MPGFLAELGLTPAKRSRVTAMPSLTPKPLKIRAGLPQHRPGPMQRRQVDVMAGHGVPETDIAHTIGIDPKTLRKHYRRELDIGHVRANVRVAETLLRKATGDGRHAVTAAIFRLKARAGWRETRCAS